MNEELKDKGLKRAIKEQPQFRLSSNFTFRTMQKVEEAALLREKEWNKEHYGLLLSLPCSCWQAALPD